jgi:hypothetical protein
MDELVAIKNGTKKARKKRSFFSSKKTLADEVTKVSEFCSECRSTMRMASTAFPPRPTSGVGPFEDVWSTMSDESYVLCGSMPGEGLADAPWYLEHVLDDTEAEAREARLGPPTVPTIPHMDGILPIDGSADDDLVAMLAQQERYHLRRAGVPTRSSGTSSGSGISLTGGTSASSSSAGNVSSVTVQPLSPAVRYPAPAAIPGAIDETILHAKDRVDATPWVARLLVGHAESMARAAGRDDDVARLQHMRAALLEEERRRFGSAAD